MGLRRHCCAILGSYAPNAALTGRAGGRAERKRVRARGAPSAAQRGLHARRIAGRNSAWSRRTRALGAGAGSSFSCLPCSNCQTASANRARPVLCAPQAPCCCVRGCSAVILGRAACAHVLFALAHGWKSSNRRVEPALARQRAHARRRRPLRSPVAIHSVLRRPRVPTAPRTGRTQSQRSWNRARTIARKHPGFPGPVHARACSQARRFDISEHALEMTARVQAGA